MEIRKDNWSASDEPIYNIGVVSRMTGIPVATLRVWERRYKFPKATRTTGGHRLYSEEEMVRLRWVKANIDEGMQTSQAIRALRSRERTGRIPELTPAPAPVAPPQPAPALAESPLENFRRRLFTAFVRHDLAEAEQVLSEVLSVSAMENVVLDVIRPTLVDIGEGWIAGQIDVATEHFASQFIRQRLILWLISGPPAHPVAPIVLACAPDEWHEISLLMLGVLLRRRRWPVAYLGQAVPLADLAKFVHEMKPPAVVVAAMTEASARQLLPLAQWLPEAATRGRPHVAFGGAAFTNHPELIPQIPGTYLGSSLTEGVETLEHLLINGGSHV